MILKSWMGPLIECIRVNPEHLLKIYGNKLLVMFFSQFIRLEHKNCTCFMNKLHKKLMCFRKHLYFL